MSQSTIWWLLAGGAVALELATGTFYLLMLAVGFAAGALAAHSGASEPVQIVVAAIFCLASVLLCHFIKGRGAKALPAGSNPDVNMDVGETVQVDGWQQDGTSQVRYRGAQWTAVQGAGGVASTGAHRIREVVGSKLVVEKI